MSALPQRYLSPEDYLQIEEKAEYRSEYYRGEMIRMTGASIAHVRINNNLIFQLNLAVRNKACEVMSNDMKVKIEGESSYRYPDTIVVCGEPVFETPKNTTLLNPLLLVEVVSDSTASVDHILKLRLYKKIPSLKHYMIVQQKEAWVELFTRKADGSWEHTDREGLEGAIVLEFLGIELALKEIYRTIEFPVVEKVESTAEVD